MGLGEGRVRQMHWKVPCKLLSAMLHKISKG